MHAGNQGFNAGDNFACNTRRGSELSFEIRKRNGLLVPQTLRAIRYRAVLHGGAFCPNIRQNLVFAFAYNAIGIPGAAGVLYPTFGILLSLVVAALAMSLSSVPVIANVLRLRATPL